MKEPEWLTVQDVEIYQEDQIRLNGGLAGLRDREALEAALARPVNLFLYEKADLPALAAAYAHGIAKSHPFHDGNKRAGFVSAVTFLDSNGIEINMIEEEATVMMVDLTTGAITQEEFAEYLRSNCEKRELEQKREEQQEHRRGRSR